MLNPIVTMKIIALIVYGILLLLGTVLLLLKYSPGILFTIIGLAGLIWEIVFSGRKRPPSTSASILKVLVVVIIIRLIYAISLDKKVDLFGMITGLILLAGVYIYFKFIVPNIILKK